MEHIAAPYVTVLFLGDQTESNDLSPGEIKQTEEVLQRLEANNDNFMNIMKVGPVTFSNTLNKHHNYKQYL